MRLLLSKRSKKELYKFLKNKHSCNSIKGLSRELNISVKTINGWFYIEKRYIPELFIDKKIIGSLEILDKQDDNWGMVVGGRNSYDNVIKRYGIKEIKRRQALGGKRGAETKDKIEREKFYVNIKDPLFLEFYGVIMGDGWIGSYEKAKWSINLCGHLKLDKDFVLYIKENVKKLFDRQGFIFETLKTNTINFRFSHKILFEFLSKELNFPIGKKKNLKINDRIYSLSFGKVKNVIRGIFDTDGTFYLSRNRKGIPSYPCMAIHMNSPILIKQIGDVLLDQGYKPNYSDHGTMLRLSGKVQLKKWMEEIGSSNPKHLNKINKFLEQNSN